MPWAPFHAITDMDYFPLTLFSSPIVKRGILANGKASATNIYLTPPEIPFTMCHFLLISRHGTES